MKKECDIDTFYEDLITIQVKVNKNKHLMKVLVTFAEDCEPRIDEFSEEDAAILDDVIYKCVKKISGPFCAQPLSVCSEEEERPQWLMSIKIKQE